MNYYIRFDENSRLEISRYKINLPECNYTPIRLKTYATMNAFFVILNLGNLVKPLLDGAILNIFIPSTLIDPHDQKSFLTKIKQTRYNCHLNDICSSLFTVKYLTVEPRIKVWHMLPNSKGNYYDLYYEAERPVIDINQSYYDIPDIIEVLSSVKSHYYSNGHSSISSTKIPNGGITVMFMFSDHYDYDLQKDTKFLRLLGILGKLCTSHGWMFEVKWANHSNWIVVQIYRYSTDLYTKFPYSTITKFGSTTSAGLTQACYKELSRCSY